MDSKNSCKFVDASSRGPRPEQGPATTLQTARKEIGATSAAQSGAFLFSTATRPTLWPILPSNRSSVVNETGLEIDDSLLSISEDQNTWSYISVPPLTTKSF
jgi:hypothetical protein